MAHNNKAQNYPPPPPPMSQYFQSPHIYQTGAPQQQQQQMQHQQQRPQQQQAQQKNVHFDPNQTNHGFRQAPQLSWGYGSGSATSDSEAGYTSGGEGPQQNRKKKLNRRRRGPPQNPTTGGERPVQAPLTYDYKRIVVHTLGALNDISRPDSKHVVVGFTFGNVQGKLPSSVTATGIIVKSEKMGAKPKEYPLSSIYISREKNIDKLRGTQFKKIHLSDEVSIGRADFPAITKQRIHQMPDKPDDLVTAGTPILCRMESKGVAVMEVPIDEGIGLFQITKPFIDNPEVGALYTPTLEKGNLILTMTTKATWRLEATNQARDAHGERLELTTAGAPAAKNVAVPALAEFI